MSENVAVTYLGQQPAVKGPHAVGGLKVVLPSGEESYHEVRITHRARDRLEGEMGRPLTGQEMDTVLQCWGEKCVRSLLSAGRLVPGILSLTGREVVGIEAQLLLRQCGLL